MAPMSAQFVPYWIFFAMGLALILWRFRACDLTALAVLLPFLGLSLMYNRALGYDMNALEFAYKDGRYYGIDLTNYTPDLDYRSLKDAHFPWAVEKMAAFAVEKALSPDPTPAVPDWKGLLRK